MARPIWNGAISFGLVSIPVKLYSATVDRAVRFHQIDSRSGSRVRQKRVSEADGTEVAYEDIVKGYELSSGRYVTISDDEMAALDPKASRTIDLLEFVDLESIDPIYYDAAYYLAPDPATAKPYALLLNAMSDAGKVGIARFVMRGKERLCALRADDDKLVLSTMRYADEIRDVEEIE
jgi:DNA end-binding protein Ku